MQWLDWLKLILPIVASIISLSVGALLWALRKTYVSREEFDEYLKAQTAHDRRLIMVEQRVGAYPKSDKLHEDIGDITERMASVEATLSGLQKLLNTQNDYLKMIVEKGLRE
jgi:hypothetical protein